MVFCNLYCINSCVKVVTAIFVPYCAKPPSCVHEFVFTHFLVHSADETIHSCLQMQIITMRQDFFCEFCSV